MLTCLPPLCLVNEHLVNEQEVSLCSINQEGFRKTLCFLPTLFARFFCSLERRASWGRWKKKRASSGTMRLCVSTMACAIARTRATGLPLGTTSSPNRRRRQGNSFSSHLQVEANLRKVGATQCGLKSLTRMILSLFSCLQTVCRGLGVWQRHRIS